MPHASRAAHPRPLRALWRLPCERDRRVVEDRSYCEACAARPEVNYLETFRLKYWGKRDRWAWIIGIGAVLQLVSAPVLLARGGASVPLGLLALVGAGVGAAFWRGQPFARQGLCWLVLANVGVSALAFGWQTATLSVWALLIAFAIYQDPRNRLFFRQPVPPVTLRKLWRNHAHNGMARVGFALGVCSLLFWPLAPVAFACSLAGLLRVDLKARPPVGRRGEAIAGLVCSVLGPELYIGMIPYLIHVN